MNGICDVVQLTGPLWEVGPVQAATVRTPDRAAA